MKQHRVKSVKVEFADENVTAFGGYVLAERLAQRLGLWTALGRALPDRRGRFDWLDVIRSAVVGLLTGSRGTYATEQVREEKALLAMLGVDGAPEEATFWRCLKGLGEGPVASVLSKTHRTWVRDLLGRARRRDLLVGGFFPVFGDGTLLEGSRRREGTKSMKDKGEGLLWATWFCGPLVAAQSLAAAGEGEQALLESMLDDVVADVLEPLRLKELVLLLLDSLHGDGPTFDRAEARGLHYIIGVNKLAETHRVLSEHPDALWVDTGARPERGWDESAVCVCWLQCEGWKRKRLLVGRRWKRAGELLYHYAGVATDLREDDVAHLIKPTRSFAAVIWWLYDRKAGGEDHYKDLLNDLGLHHPPCRELVRNRGFYAVATFAHTLARGVDLIGGTSGERGSMRRHDGRRRKRAKPRRMRLWRLVRRFFALAGRVACHGRQACVTLLGVSPTVREEFNQRWQRICCC